jgi:hypothetical protein
LFPVLTAEPTDVPSQGPTAMRHLRPLKQHNYQFTAIGYNKMDGMRSYKVGAALIFQDSEIMYFKRILKDIHYF